MSQPDSTQAASPQSKSAASGAPHVSEKKKAKVRKNVGKAIAHDAFAGGRVNPRWLCSGA